MNLTISAGKQSFAVPLPDDKCGEIYGKLVKAVMKDLSESVSLPAVEIPKDQSFKRFAQRTLNAKEPELTATQKPEERAEVRAYKGFLHIMCPVCGEVRSFNAKTETSSYHCNVCGIDTELVAMVPLYVNCECGRRYRYLTNIMSGMFDIPCFNCGCPVAVQFNPKYGTFESIGAPRGRQKKR